LREQAAQRIQETVWGDPEVRDRLLFFHRSPEERARRSRAQSKRMQENPGKYLRGRAAWVATPKGTQDQVYVRSSYEKAAVAVLEAASEVVTYEYERRFELKTGKWILPDFLVTMQDGPNLLVEVKAAWVFNLPYMHKVHVRLRETEDLARQLGFGFAIWTEKELGNAFSAAA